MVNNVAVLGHSHPAVTAAAARQFGLLNTNSRFSYDGIVSYAERIVELLPDPLDTVLFVNSGSEAVDLALRIVRNATGRKDTICLAGGYHGWSTATDEISTSLNDNPDVRGHPATVGPPRRRCRTCTAASIAAPTRPTATPTRSAPSSPVCRTVRRHSSPSRCPATPAGVELPAGYLRAGVRRGARRRRAGDLRRGADRLRPYRRGVLGIRAARRRAGRGHDGQGGRQRPSDRLRGHPSRDRRAVLRAGLVLLLGRWQPGLVGGRYRRAGRDPRRGSAGQCRSGRGPSDRAAGRRWQPAIDDRVPSTAAGSIKGIELVRDPDDRASRRRRRRPRSASGCASSA